MFYFGEAGKKWTKEVRAQVTAELQRKGYEQHNVDASMPAVVRWANDWINMHAEVVMCKCAGLPFAHVYGSPDCHEPKGGFYCGDCGRSGDDNNDPFIYSGGGCELESVTCPCGELAEDIDYIVKTVPANEVHESYYWEDLNMLDVVELMQAELARRAEG